MKFLEPHSLSAAHGSLDVISSLLEQRFVVTSIHCASGQQPNIDPRLKTQETLCV
jgi:hypothetical protein